jgi:Bacterial protein of unknown function (DUF916)
MAGLSKICTTAMAMVLLAATLILGSPPAGAATATAPPGATPAGSGISLQPAHVDPAHPISYFTFDSAAGTQITDAVVVTNKSKVPVTLDVAAVDGLTGQTTGSVYANQGDPVRNAGMWVSLPGNSIELAPSSSKTVSFTVSVPSDAVAGDHLAGVAFQSPPAAATAGGFQVTQVIRNVIGVLVIVPGPAVFHPKLTNLMIQQIGLTGIASVVVALSNDGLLLGKPILQIALSGPNGYRATLSKTLDTVLPGDSVNFPFAWPDRLAQGSYDITAELTGGGVTATLRQNYYLGTKLAGTTQPLKPVSHSTNYWAWTGAAAGALLVIGLLVLLVILARRRRHGGSATANSGEPITPTDLLMQQFPEESTTEVRT